MKTLAGFSLALVFATACGSSAPSPQLVEDAPATNPPRTDVPPAPALPGTPTSSELTDDLGIFVKEAGNDAASGTHTHPLGSIQKGIELAVKAGKRVYVCAGTFKEQLVLANGIPMVGGLDCSAEAWTVGMGRSRVQPTASPVVRAASITTPTRIEGFEFDAPNATPAAPSSIALFATDASALTIADSRLVAGRGADGAAGAEGVQLSAQYGAAGAGAAHAHYQCPAGTNCITVTGDYKRLLGGAAGTVACIGAAGHDGQAGGAGGTGGVWSFTNGGWNWWNGHASEAAAPGDARTGARGRQGASGASATGTGVFTRDGYVPADGAIGSDGTPGDGGRGGDGTMPSPSPASFNFNEAWSGNAGSGGGAGGCPGLAGTAGKGGGASVAALLFASAVTFDNSELLSGDGGAGGRGAFGSEALSGGQAGPSMSGVAGTRGEPGGGGGASGVSGSGAGGPSFAIAHTGGAPRLTATTTKAGRPGAGVNAESRSELLGDIKTIAASDAGLAAGLFAF